MPPQTSASKTTEPWFPVPRAIIDYLPSLTPIELSVTLIHLHYQSMSPANEVYCGYRRLADDLGHRDIRHVQRAIRSLIEKGIIQTITVGGGNVPSRRRVVLRPSAKSADTVNIADTAESADGVSAESTMGVSVDSVADRRRNPPPIKRLLIETSNRDNKRDKAGAGKNGDVLSFPGELDTPGFRAAWADWEQHRQQIKKKLTPLTTQKQITTLQAMGVDRAIIAINRSIAAGWTGIFSEKDSHNGHSNGTRQTKHSGLCENLTCD